MEPETAVFQQIVFMEALTTSSWKKYFPHLSDAGITTIEDLLETSDETLDALRSSILPAPLDRVKALKKNLSNIRQQRNNSFTTPLSENNFFDQFEFVPQFTCEQYLADIPMKNITSEIEVATNKVVYTGYDDLTKHQAIFIALYCQESVGNNTSFYRLTNQCMRERNEQLIGMRSALYLLESGLRSLPPIEDVTWRGMNFQPDLKKFVVGQTVCFTGICSSSTDKDQTLRFMGTSPREGMHKRTLFKLHMINGVSIQKWSCFKYEQEVVASFCSRWKVIKVEQNYEEIFDSVGSYNCDYYIELQQLHSEPLFRSNIKLTGLHLLSKVDFEKPTDLNRNFKMKFFDFFHQLADVNAQQILESVLSPSNYWNKENKNFKNNPENQEIFDLIANFLVGVGTLSTEFQHHGIDLKKGFEICEMHQIYSAVHLLSGNNDVDRTIDDFEQLGFDTECAKKLYNQEHLKEELRLWYKRLNYGGTLESPENVGKWLLDLRFKHHFMRDGIMITINELARISIYGAKHLSPQFRNLFNGSIQFDHFNYGTQYSDFAIAGVIFAVQFGMYSFQLWHGDITTRQFLKSISTGAIAVAGGFAGGLAASYFVAACATLLGYRAEQTGMAVFFGAVAGGLVCGGGADYIFRRLSEKFLPDGELEEINAQRKLYCTALETLACNPDSTIENIKKAYYRKAQATHPDKCDNKKVAEEDFKKILAAYEIAKNYHDVLEDARKILNISNITDILTVCKPNTTASPKTKRAYDIVYRHHIYNTNKWQRIRNWFDSDKSLELRDSMPKAIEKSK